MGPYMGPHRHLTQEIFLNENLDSFSKRRQFETRGLNL